MPLYSEKIAEKLEEKEEDLEETVDENVDEKFREALESVAERNRDSVKEELEPDINGAIPTEEFFQDPFVEFSPSREWSSHESVNDWAREKLEGNSIVAADGSQVDPVDEFETPVGLVQVAWMENRYDGEYDEDVEIEFLAGEELIHREESGSWVDDEEVPARRFEKEVEVLVERIESQEPGLVLYDGSLIPSFTRVLVERKQERYLDAVTELLAASRKHRIPLIGYVSGSRASEISRMLNEWVDHEPIRDSRIVSEKLSWGDRTAMFESRRGPTLEKLETSYEGENYNFSDRILFTYLKTGENQIDRIEMPKWMLEEEVHEKAIELVTAEASIGRGYPEILQTVDADAVISSSDRKRFLEILQRFSREKDLDIEWNNKARSKKRRRR